MSILPADPHRPCPTWHGIPDHINDFEKRETVGVLNCAGSSEAALAEKVKWMR